MKEVLVEEEGLNRQGGSVWIERGGGCSAVATPLGDITRGSEVSEREREREREREEIGRICNFTEFLEHPLKMSTIFAI